MEKIDYQVIIVWNSNPDLIKIVHQTFSEKIILEKKISLSKDERIQKINELYAPIHVPHNSERCLYIEPLTIFLVEMKAKYRYFNRTEGYLLCNSAILDFKYKHRRQFDYKIFHCSDSITEAMKALKVLGLLDNELLKKMQACAIVDVKNLFVIRHLEDKSFVIVPIQDACAVRHLQGYDINDLQKRYNFNGKSDPSQLIVQKNTIDYINQLSDFNQEHPLCDIRAYNYNGKHIIIDGMHRASLLYYQGYRHIFVQETKEPCEKEKLDNVLVQEPVSHLENLHQFIFALHNKDIRFICVRGWKTMPKTADTDLDIVIHPEDYTKFLNVIQQFITEQKIAFNIEVPYSSPIYQAWYRAYRTLGSRNDFLTNNGYQLDTYNNVFFFGKEKTAMTLSSTFLNYLFDNKKMYHQLFIPNEISEMVLLFCRTFIDLNGQWKEKHRKRFDELKTYVNKDEFTKTLKMALGNNLIHLLDHIDSCFM